MSESPVVSDQPETPQKPAAGKESAPAASGNLGQRLEQLHRHMSEAVEKVVQEFREDIGDRVRRGSQEMLRRVEALRAEIPGSLLDLSSLAEETVEVAGEKAAAGLVEAIAHVDGEKSQEDVLLALLEEGRRFASRTAVFLTRAEAARGWSGLGFVRGGPAIKGLEVDYAGGGWAELARGVGAVRLGAEECAALARKIDARAAEEGVLIPLVLRDQVGAALYADRLEGEDALGVASLQLLCHAAAQAIETLPFRGREISPGLRFSSDVAADATGLPLWQAAAPRPAAPPAAEPEPSAAPELEPVAEAVEPEPEAEPVEPEQPEPPELEPVAEAVEPEPEPEVEAESVEPERPEPPELEPAPTFEGTESAELELEAEEPPPELEEGEDIWATDEEEDEDDEPTEVGTAVAVEPEAPSAEAEAEPAEAQNHGQQTVRLDIASYQQQPPEAPEPPAVPATEAPSAEAPSAEGVELPSVDTPVASPSEVEPFPPEEAPEWGTEEEEEETASYELEEVPAPAAAESVGGDEDEEPTLVGTQEDLAGGGAPATQEAEPPEPAAPAAQEPQSPQSAPGYVPPAPDSKTDATSGGSTQVQPPEDLQGPGLAFTKSAPPGTTEEEEALHEEARRLARLLVSEIKLYNEEIIEEGRRTGDIYERLKDDIDRSRQMYQERIDPRLQGKEDYFRQELVQRLAGGDESLLGM